MNLRRSDDYKNFGVEDAFQLVPPKIASKVLLGLLAICFAIDAIQKWFA